MAATNKQGKMTGFINYKMRATMKDGRQLVGQMLAFDKHMNLVLADCEEFRKVKRKAKGSAPGASTQSLVETEEKRALGLAIIRGATVVSCSVDGPPPADPSARLGTSAPGGAAAPAVAAGPGISRPAGRGAGIGLAGPAAGQGAPGFPGAGFPGAGRGGPPGFGGPPPGFPPQGGPPPGFGGGPPGFGRGFGGPPGGQFPPR